MEAGLSKLRWERVHALRHLRHLLHLYGSSPEKDRLPPGPDGTTKCSKRCAPTSDSACENSGTRASVAPTLFGRRQGRHWKLTANILSSKWPTIPARL